MFVVWLMHQDTRKDKVVKYVSLQAAIDAARSEALYGPWRTTKVYDDDTDEALVLFSAKEMRDAAKRKREARCLQVSAGLHGGLQVHAGVEVGLPLPVDTGRFDVI